MKNFLPKKMPVLEAASAKPQHVAICVPCVDKPHLEFARCLAMMFYQNGVQRLPTAVVTSGGSIISKTRNNCIAAVEDMESKQGIEFSHIFFLDSDMTFPDYVLLALLKHQKDIVGCTYVRRTPPYDVHGKALRGRTEIHEGLLEVAGLPTGCLLIKREIFRALRRPYFRFPFKEESSPGAGDHFEIGEDYAFCQAARHEGRSVWLDAGMSKLIGHVGEQVLYPDRVHWPEVVAPEGEAPVGLDKALAGVQ